MDDFSQQIRRMADEFQNHVAALDKILEGLPKFRTNELDELMFAVKGALAESTRVAVFMVELATKADLKRSEVQASLDQGRKLIEAVRNGSVPLAQYIADTIGKTPHDAQQAVTFPFSTKSLEAASQAATKFWTTYDPERPPLQKTVAAFIAEQGVPARQAQELAIAIKPDAAS